MSALAQVPAWFWVTLGTIVALAFLVLSVLALKDRHYRPAHRAAPYLVLPPVVDLPAASATVPVAAVDGKPPWELAHEPTAAEVAASRAAHGYIPELDTDAGDLGPGAGTTVAGYNSHLPSPRRTKVDSPAPDWPEWTGDPADPEPLRPVPLPLLSGRDLALARCDLFMVAMEADHERWMASARERWAA